MAVFSKDDVLVIGCDHGGFTLKQEILKHLDEIGVKFNDVGCYSTDSVDYPDIALKLTAEITSGKSPLGILVCGTGIGMSMAANKVKGIRAAACSEAFSAEFTRRHNDANVLCLGGRVIGPGIACQLVDLFINTPFEGGRHVRRVEAVMNIEKN